jgi:hypothetical protein
MDPNIPTKGFLTNVQYMFDLRDVVIDVQGGWPSIHHVSIHYGSCCGAVHTWRRHIICQLLPLTGMLLMGRLLLFCCMYQCYGV